MSNTPTKTELNTPAEKLQALQYLLNVAEQAPVPLAVHNQTKTYAQALFNLLVLGNPSPAVQAEGSKSVADAVAAAQAEKVVETPVVVAE